MRSSVLENLVQDYVRTARAKDATERRVLWGHVFRNSMITTVATIVGNLLADIGYAMLDPRVRYT